ncbi:hypothetical protein DEJ30_13670 [Curtobacterium sp. MCPF17_003]|nr:hypothetical protein DEJ30_13670 [Curtobacterium sp. MCPF17_003]
MLASVAPSWTGPKDASPKTQLEGPLGLDEVGVGVGVGVDLGVAVGVVAAVALVCVALGALGPDAVAQPAAPMRSVAMPTVRMVVRSVVMILPSPCSVVVPAILTDVGAD